jgi:hypothetical protein
VLASFGGSLLSPQEISFSQFGPVLLRHQQALQRCIHTLPVLCTDEFTGTQVNSLEPLSASLDGVLLIEPRTSGTAAAMSEQGKGPVKLLNALRKLIATLLPLCRHRSSLSPRQRESVLQDAPGNKGTLHTDQPKARVVEVTGPRGSGKSAIARAAALACSPADALYAPQATLTIKSNLHWIATFYVDLSLCSTMDAAISRLCHAIGLVPHELDSDLPMDWLAFQFSKCQAPLGLILDNADSMPDELLRRIVQRLGSSHPQLQLLVTLRRSVLSKANMASAVQTPPLPAVCVLSCLNLFILLVQRFDPKPFVDSHNVDGHYGVCLFGGHPQCVKHMHDMLQSTCLAWLRTGLSSVDTVSKVSCVRLSRGLPGLADLFIKWGTPLSKHQQLFTSFIKQTSSAKDADEHFQLVHATLAEIMLQQQSAGAQAFIAAVAAFSLPCPLAVAQQIARVLNPAEHHAEQQTGDESKGGHQVSHLFSISPSISGYCFCRPPCCSARLRMHALAFRCVEKRSMRRQF